MLACLFAAFLTVAQVKTATAAELMAVHLSTEMRDDPLGIGARQPRFGWTLEAKDKGERGLLQSGYRIVVASSREKLVRDQADVWDSGRVASTTFWQIPYGGPALHAHTTYYWHAEVWDGQSAAGEWSRPANFTTGLLTPSDWTAHWIAAEPDRGPWRQALEHRGTPNETRPPPLPIFRRDFRVPRKVASALLFVSGLGQYEVRLNGVNVTSTVLNPAWSDYRHTVPYDTYEVRALLRPGANALGVLLGNGMYNVEGIKGRYTKFIGSFGQPKLILQLEVHYADGTEARFVSDSSWKTHAGPVMLSSIYGGEDFDASAEQAGWDRVGFKAKDWKQSLEVDGPGGELIARRSEPIVIADHLQAVRTTTPAPGVTVFDLGKNMSGWPWISVRGPAHSSVQMLPGESLDRNGMVTQRSAGASPQNPVLFRYTLRGGESEETWHPRFSYYGFRYVQVTAQAATPKGAKPEVLSLGGDFVHADVSIAGRFTSSNTLFNRIHALIDRAVLSNLVSVVTDCPTREKLGWLEQTYLNASTLMFNYDVTGLYEKMTRDMKDAQLPDGLVPGIAPEYVAFVDQSGKSTAFRDSPEWGSAVILSPWALYQFTGDALPLHEAYSAMQRYAAYLRGRSQDHMLSYGLGDWYDAGPAPPGKSQLTSKCLTATATYYEDLVVLARVATLLGHAADAADYNREAVQVRNAFNAKLFDPATDRYDRGSQTAEAMPLALGIVRENHVQGVLANLVADIRKHDNHVTAGDVGFHYVVRALTDAGRSDVLAAMLARTDSPSYGFQLAQGATTLTEAWDADPNSSQNHFMLGHGEEWFYRGLAGISVDMARGPNAAIELRPSLIAGVQSASAEYRTAMDMVRSAWRRTSDGGAVFDVTVPVGTEAALWIPAIDAATGLYEHGRPAANAPGVLNSKRTLKAWELRLGSGMYQFTVSTARAFMR